MNVQDFYISKKNLETFSQENIDILLNHFKIAKGFTRNDTLWQLAFVIIGNIKTSKMAPTKVFEKYGSQLFEKSKTDRTVKDQNPEWIKAKFIEMDPDGGKNVEWLVISYINGGIRLIEDLGRANEAIKKYTFLKNNRLIDETDKRTLFDFGGLIGYSNNKGQVKQGLEDFLDGFKDIDTEAQSNKKVPDEERIIHYQDSDFIVIQPLTERASCKYGAQTKWCTAARKNNMFKGYSEDGKLFIVIPKKPKYPDEKYQLHFETDSFMNEKDIEVHLSDLEEEFPGFVEAFKNNINEYYLKLIKKLPDHLYKFFYDDSETMTASIIIKKINKLKIVEYRNMLTVMLDNSENTRFLENILPKTLRPLTKKTLFTKKVYRFLQRNYHTNIIEKLVKNNRLDLDIFDQKEYFNLLQTIMYTASPDFAYKLLTDTKYPFDKEQYNRLLHSLSRNNIITEDFVYKVFTTTKYPIDYSILYSLSYNNKGVIKRLIMDDKIDVDKVDQNGDTILPFLRNIDLILYVLSIKKTPILEKDLTNMIFDDIRDLKKIENLYTKEQILDILKSYIQDNIENVMNYPGLSIDDIISYIYSEAVCYERDWQFFDKFIKHPNSPKWTVNNNPFLHVLNTNCPERTAKGREKEHELHVNHILNIILENEQCKPFLANLNPVELDNLITLCKKAGMSWVGDNIIDKVKN
jgi:hypothetical protein